MTRTVALALVAAFTLGSLTFLAGLVSSFLIERFLAGDCLVAVLVAVAALEVLLVVVVARALETAFLTPALSVWEPRSFLLFRREVDPSSAFPILRFASVTFLLALLVVERDFLGSGLVSLSLR